MREMKGETYKRRRRRRRRGRGEEEEQLVRSQTRPKRGWPPMLPTVTLRSHSMEHRIPLRSLDIGAKVLVETMAWSAIVAFNF